MIIVRCVQVESLTAARKSALNGQEPSDAIRVVNAFLTQIDQIKRYFENRLIYDPVNLPVNPNVLGIKCSAVLVQGSGVRSPFSNSCINAWISPE